ncbi:MAG: glycerol-3-phosphate 1-O-acyltransferase PlsY [Brevundimonas sp.]|uniref:glycerol-3-phosphate 1-O-acyltransferase PlsY n=1 Tax=Brevundimonas sp. TaxID=1871086 RepID=UPI002AB90764|nr:glycerol-3-phosphate 1-O-acyltransferase PlsY [Brevundimonas sp.]MDZ4113839.1 glycerol-3-phosphate 1-O-acyltransferase PlsY [Brevundimonas sp.]
MQDLAGIAVLTLLMAALGGYLVGSIPFGVLLTRAAGAGDVRNIGSGNIGATNVLRTGRKDLAFATLVLDAGKGAAALLIARAITDNDAVAAIAGGAAFLGHLYPVWLGFRGGKGVATFFGLMLAAAWPLGLVAAAVWLLTAAVFRVSSLSALVATLVTPVLALMPIAVLNLPTPNSVFLLALVAMALIWLRHFDNIIRLIKGKEPRIGAKSA